MDPQWARWARELLALSQTGLHYSQSQYDTERYRRLGEVAAEIAASNSTLPAADLVALSAREFGYATPKVDVRGAAWRDGRILMVREIADDGRWTLPGGWADVNESPATATERELFEESGFTARAVRLLAVYDRECQGHTPPFPFHVYKMIFECEITGGEPRPNSEASEIAFLDPAELPELSLSRVTPAQVARLAHLHRNPGLPADFD